MEVEMGDVGSGDVIVEGLPGQRETFAASGRRRASPPPPRRKNQFGPWLGDRFALGAALLRSLARRESHASLEVPGRLPPPHTANLVSSVPRAPAVAGGQLIERVLHRACDGAARAKAHHTHLHTHTLVHYIHYTYTRPPRIHEGVRARARSTRASCRTHYRSHARRVASRSGRSSAEAFEQDSERKSIYIYMYLYMYMYIYSYSHRARGEG